jgi:hypothetical protein
MGYTEKGLLLVIVTGLLDTLASSGRENDNRRIRRGMA